MESRIAVISIIVENSDSVECLNRILHEFGIYIIGRMGIPYRQRGISIISVAIDAPLDIINALTGLLLWYTLFKYGCRQIPAFFGTDSVLL